MSDKNHSIVNKKIRPADTYTHDTCFSSSLVDICLFFQVILNSMHKYRPRIHIIPSKDYNMFSMKKGSFYTFVFNETEFMAVTAYQNPRVSEWSGIPVAVTS